MSTLFTGVTLKPLLSLEQQIDATRGQSSKLLFNELLYAGELIVKLVVAGMVAGVQRDVDKYQYRHCYNIVRADGLGSWGEELNSMLTGPTAQYLNAAIRTEELELTKRTKQQVDWQFQAVHAMHKALHVFFPEAVSLPREVLGRFWLILFAQLRNKTRGHGVITESKANVAAPYLEEAIGLFVRSFSLFKRPWAYLVRTQSSKYKVTRLNQEATDCRPIRDLGTNVGTTTTLVDGLYIWLDDYCYVELAFSPQHDGNLFFPNGNFKDKYFEALSYEDGTTQRIDSAPYLAPVGSLPASETQGSTNLYVIGENSFSNLPTQSIRYINRPDLEHELRSTLTNPNRHYIVVLHGRGGIGKTSLALNVLYEIAKECGFELILWFSARDIDLLPEGPKDVKAHFVSENGVAEEYIRLVNPGSGLKGKKAIEEFEKSLQAKALDKPILFVFDNFETVTSPLGLFRWIETHLRQPNKVLITTRIQDFKGTYDVEVSGMLEDEANALVDAEAQRLGIVSLITPARRKDLVAKADGHPYIIKVLLGEVAYQGKWVDAERAVATKEQMLTALFERTYSHISPLAKRIFLTACQWRSTIPVLALKMVLMRSTPETIDVQKAIDELTRSSFIEVNRSEADGQEFVSVPLTAEIFGRQKMEVEAISSAVLVDVKHLQDFGPAQDTNTRQGLTPRINRFFTALEKQLARGERKLDDAVGMLEFIANSYPYTWLLIADLYEDSNVAEAPILERNALQRYLQQPLEPSEKARIWVRIANVSKDAGDAQGEVHAWSSLASLPDTSYQEVSNAAHRITNLIKSQQFTPEREERELMLEGLATVMQERLPEATATDCSRLAWLYLMTGHPTDAYEVVEYGLELDAQNEHLIKLSDRLSEQFAADSL